MQMQDLLQEGMQKLEQHPDHQEDVPDQQQVAQLSKTAQKLLQLKEAGNRCNTHACGKPVHPTYPPPFLHFHPVLPQDHLSLQLKQAGNRGDALVCGFILSDDHYRPCVVPSLLVCC